MVTANGGPGRLLRSLALVRAEARPYNGRYNFEPKLWLGCGIVEV